jgi:Uma2 family endonuclease
MMATNPQQIYITVEEYLRLDNESSDACYDYIDGHVIRCAGGSPQHAEIATNLISVLRPFLRGSPCHIFSSDVRIRLSESRYVHPDIAVSCDERDWADPVAIRYPSLVIEVLSPSTELRDRGQKFAEYRACPSLQEYVLVNFAYQEVELYRREKGHLWSFQTFQLDAHVELASLGVRFPVTDVYGGVFFPSGDENQPA